MSFIASFFAKKVAKHVLKESSANKQGTEDPYFEQVAAVDLNGNSTGKIQKRKRAVPPGLTQQEENVLKKVTRRAYRLDNAFNICGMRIGWGAIIGIIPALGDVFDSAMALMVFRTCTQLDLPASLRSRMMFNICLDFVIGLLPVIGDVADALYRANTKNAVLLHDYLRDQGAARIASGEKPATTGPGLIDQKVAPGSRPTVDQQSHQRQQQVSGHNQAFAPVQANAGDISTSDPIARPEQVRTTKEGGSRGWLSRFSGGGGGGAQHADLESGELSELPPRR